MTSVTNIRLRVLPRFPANLQGTNGITVVREGAGLIVKPDYGAVTETSNIPNPAETLFLAWNRETDSYTSIAFQSMFDNSGNAAGFQTIAAAELASISPAVHAIELYGDAVVGDGLGGLYIDANNGSANTFVSGDGRTWYFAPDIGVDRLTNAGTAGKAILADELTADVRGYLDTPVYVADRAAMAALDITKDSISYLRESGRQGNFEVDSSNLSAKVTADTAQIGYVAPASDPTGATGAWRRNLKLSRLYPEMAGVIGDDVSRVGAYLAAQKFLDFCAREKAVGVFSGGGLYRLDGFLITKTGLYLESEPGAILRPTEWSIYAGGGGSFISNAISAVTPDLNVNYDVRLSLKIDGSLMPTTNWGYAVSATTNTVTLPTSFDGKIRAGISRLSVVVGTNAGEAKVVTAWNPATRVATISGNWTVIPDTTSFIGEGANDNAFGGARGLNDAVLYIEANDFMPTGMLSGSGGKGLNLEQGCRKIDATVIAERCGWAGWVNGVPGSFAGYSAENIALGNDRRWSRDIRFRVNAKDCQSAFGLYGIQTGAGEDPDGSGNNSFVVADVMARNCGHAVTRPVGSDAGVKSGILTLAEGNNARISLYSVIDADFAPVWPSAPFIGAGLSGTIGAVVQGWANEVTIDATHVGPTDSLYNLDRCRAMYDDASPTGIPQKVHGLNIRIKHHGSQPAQGLIWQKGTAGTVPTSGVTANLDFDTDYYPTNICGTNIDYANIDLKVRSHLVGSTTSARGIEGTASRIKAEYNDLSVAAGFRNLQGFAIGAGLPITSILTTSVVHDVGTIAVGAEYSFTATVTGAATGSKVFATATYNGARMVGVSVEAFVTAANTATIYVNNLYTPTAVPKTPGSRTWGVTVESFP